MRENKQERPAISFTAIEDFRGINCIKLEPSDNIHLVDKLDLDFYTSSVIVSQGELTVVEGSLVLD
jgi:hypothetical protein